MVDHKVAHKGDMKLFWDRANWQPMCRSCNSRKAVQQEGALGKTMPGVGGMTKVWQVPSRPMPKSNSYAVKTEEIPPSTGEDQEQRKVTSRW